MAGNPSLESDLDGFRKCSATTGFFASFASSHPNEAVAVCLTLMLVHVPIGIVILYGIGRRLPREVNILRCVFQQIGVRRPHQDSACQRISTSSRNPRRGHGYEQNLPFATHTHDNMLALRDQPTLPRFKKQPLAIFCGGLYLASWGLVAVVPLIILSLQSCTHESYSPGGLWAGYAACNCFTQLLCTGLLCLLPCLHRKNSGRDGSDRSKRSSGYGSHESSNSIHEADWIGRTHSHTEVLQSLASNNGTPLRTPVCTARQLQNTTRPHRQSIQSVYSRASSNIRMPKRYRISRQHFDASRAFSNPEALLNQASRTMEELGSERIAPPPRPVTAWDRDTMFVEDAQQMTIRKVTPTPSPERSSRSSLHRSPLRLPSPLERSLRLHNPRIRPLTNTADEPLVAPRPMRPSSIIASSSYYPSGIETLISSRPYSFVDASHDQRSIEEG